MKPIEYSWLQISDLHIFDNTEWELMQDAYRKLESRHNIKFIIVTGDLHQYNDDYTKTINFLCKMVDFFGLEKKDVFIVPGNHDCKECDVKEAIVPFILNEIGNDENIYCKYYCRGKLIDCFDEYNNFIREFYGDIADTLYPNPEQVSIRNWNNKINIIHLNSAIICDGSEHDEIVDIYALKKKERQAKSNLPSIIISHHDFYALHKSHQNAMARIITDWPISAYLCGDTHKFIDDRIRTHTSSDSSIPCIICGKSSPESGDQYSDLGCIVYSKLENEDTVIVNLYQWDSEKKAFEPSSRFYSDEGELSFRLLTGNASISSRASRLSISGSPISSDIDSIWLPDAELATGSEVRFDSFTHTDQIDNYLSEESSRWGLSGVKGIGKTFVLQIKRKNMSAYNLNKLCLPVGIKASLLNNWATENIILESGTNPSIFREFYQDIVLWKYCILVYVINQVVNIEDNANSKWWQGSPSKKVLDKLNDFYKNKKISVDTYDFCTDNGFVSLNQIFKSVINTNNWREFSLNDMDKLIRLRRPLEEFLSGIRKSSVVVFIDKVDQSLSQTSAEQPCNDCERCHKVNRVTNCKNYRKSDEYCKSSDATCKATCCYGCDEFLSNFGSSSYRVYTNDSSSSRYTHISVWQYFQLSLVLAVGQIKEDFSGIIEVYFTIRQEAFSCEANIIGEHRKKFISTVDELWYSKAEQMKIFYECIKCQDDRLLFAPELKTNPEKIEQAFVGVDKLCHPYAQNLSETVFESIYRHSFDRARDVQEYGKVLTENMYKIRQCDSMEKRGECVKHIIEDKAADLAFKSDTADSSNSCYYYEKSKLLPNYWANPDNFKKLLDEIDRNLLFSQDMEKICRLFNNKTECSGKCSNENCQYHPFSMLYKLGMLGHIRANSNYKEQVAQKFMHSKDISYLRGTDLLNINDQAIYIIHPALTKSIEKHKGKSIMHFNGFILGKDIEVSQDIIKRLHFDRKTMSAEDFDKKYFFTKSEGE